MKREKKWKEIRKGGNFSDIAEQFGLSPMTARLIRNRGAIGTDAVRDYLYASTENLYDPHLMKGAEAAADLLYEKISAHRKIRIIGDYDADGVNASYILCQAIQSCGGIADCRIPDRLKDGYGLNCSLVERASSDQVDTILTCDNGISALAEIALAKKLGMTVLVTDHHEPGRELPEADVIVNPHQPDCPYPFKELCGAAVAWKVVCILYEKAGRPQEEAEEFLLYVGFATIEDIVDLSGENRILAREGLARLAASESPGYSALCKVNEVDPTLLTSHKVGFILGPCINAAGRLSSADLSLRLLFCRDEEESLRLAQQLKELNEERKSMTEEAVEQAEALIRRDASLQKDRVLVLYLPKCHEGIIGIVAGRIREQFYKPTFIFTDSAKDSVLKGSARSIDSYSMFQKMQECSDVFLNFGGHLMAAGCSIERSRLEELRERLNRSCNLSQEDLTEELLIDFELPFASISEKFIRELTLLEPTGKNNEAPLFARKDVSLISARLIGGDQSVKMVVEDGSARMEAVLFYEAEEFLAYLTEQFGQGQVEKLFRKEQNHIRLDLAFYPEINQFHNVENLQIVIKNYRYLKRSQSGPALTNQSRRE